MFQMYSDSILCHIAIKYGPSQVDVKAGESGCCSTIDLPDFN